MFTYGFESNIHNRIPVYQYPIQFKIIEPTARSGMNFQRRVKKKNIAATPRITNPSLRANGMKLTMIAPRKNFPRKLQ